MYIFDKVMLLNSYFENEDYEMLCYGENFNFGWKLGEEKCYDYDYDE